MPATSLDVLARIAPSVRPGLIERAERLAAGSAEPVAVPRLAASVVLLRDSAGGLETFLLHRHARMAFAASMVAFPGGGVEPSDRDQADELRACAVRETQEETGVVLDADDLLPWAHWITPVPEPRRYDTFFFVAALPSGQRAADLSTETEAAEWATPVDALRRFAAGAIALMPPTLSIVTELGELTDLAGVRAAGRDRVVLPVLPEVVRTSAGWSYRYPGPP